MLECIKPYMFGIGFSYANAKSLMKQNALSGHGHQTATSLDCSLWSRVIRMIVCSVSQGRPVRGNVVSSQSSHGASIDTPHWKETATVVPRPPSPMSTQLPLFTQSRFFTFALQIHNQLLISSHGADHTF